MVLLKGTSRRAIRYAGCAVIVLLSAPLAIATDANVEWSLRGVATNSNGTITYPLLGIPPGDTWLNWTLSVRVTGDNMGLSGYVLELGIRSLSGGYWAPYYPAVAGDPDSISWCPVYKSARMSGGTIKDSGDAGGPGLDALPGLGIVHRYDEAYISEMAAALLEFTPYVKTKNGWSGAQTWGVGLDSRKSTLLMNPDGTYDIEQGYIDMTGWAPGYYRVELIVREADVIKSGLSLNSGEPQSGIIYQVPLANQTVRSFEFSPNIPEPATLLLVAGGALLYRRRRTAPHRRCEKPPVR